METEVLDLRGMKEFRHNYQLSKMEIRKQSVKYGFLDSDLVPDRCAIYQDGKPEKWTGIKEKHMNLVQDT